MITKKNITQDPNEILRIKCEPVKFPLINSLRDSALEMRQYIINSVDYDIAEKYDLEPAVGIAAPQIGINKRIFAVYITDEDENIIIDEIMCNPKIISHSSKKIALECGEACLSIGKKYHGYVYRYKKIKIKFYDINGVEHIKEINNFPSIAVQHELDHLNGILYYDHIKIENPQYIEENSELI